MTTLKIGNTWGRGRKKGRQFYNLLTSNDSWKSRTGFVRFSCLYNLKSNLLSRPSRHSLPVFGHVELCQLGSYLSQFHSRLEKNWSYSLIASYHRQLFADIIMENLKIKFSFFNLRCRRPGLTKLVLRFLFCIHVKLSVIRYCRLFFSMADNRL